jgi:hypothetical protein
MPIRTPICLLEEDCLDTDPLAVLVAMAAPSYVPTDDGKINMYAGLEAMLAYRYGRKVGIVHHAIQAPASRLTAELEEDIYALAARLEQEGVIHDVYLPGM